MGHAVDPNFHENLLDKNLMSLYRFSTLRNGAFMLVVPPVFDELLKEPGLVLATEEAQYYRNSGKWIAIESAKIVGDNGKFFGSPVASLLQREIVDWWDAQNSLVDVSEALQFCSPFPYLYFGFDSHANASSIFLETDSLTWELGSDGQWARHTPDDRRATERQRLLESIVRANPAEIGDSLRKSRTSHSLRISRAIECGMLAAISPAFAQEAIDWLLHSKKRAGFSPITPGHYSDYLESLSRPRFLLNESGLISELIVSIDQVVWIRERNQWHPASDQQVSLLSSSSREISIAASRLEEVIVWWDSRAELCPDVKDAPVNLDSEREESFAPLGEDEVEQEMIDSILEYFDGVRYWLEEDGFWVVGPDSIWNELIERHFP